MKSTGAKLAILCFGIASLFSKNGGTAAANPTDSPLSTTCQKVYDTLNMAPLETGVYLFTKKFYPWDAADQLCKKLGLELASTDTKKEADIVYFEANRRNDETVRFWTSGTDKGRKPGDFIWANGSPVDESQWLRGEPVHVGEEEASCVTVRRNGLGDCRCADARKSICELPQTSGPKTCENVLDKMNIAVLETGVYKFNSESTTWNEARRYCNDLGMRLVTIDNQQEADLVFQEAARRLNNETYVWTSGINKDRKNGEYIWLTALEFDDLEENPKTVDSSLWLPGEPKNAKKKSVSGVVLKRGGLGDRMWGTQGKSVCELIQ
ncbi:macrophage mannose receptor 1-like [Neocloeon triangulifer]|uniref:macrophage mannose receptor 1-like n=1 Tax=Neocloeon triangulifer TaxID=2078957 RepID=UPI00286F0D6F|nr:macrophage mannose receptor 1-like [Neocloeon triangulifer]